jgi:PHD finger-like domain-containing protein 5A
MAKHHPDLVMCRKQPGIAIGRLCEKCMSFLIMRIHKCFLCFLFGFIMLRLNNNNNNKKKKKGDGKCVICDSYVRPAVLTHICDECNYGSYEGRCVICGGPGISDAYYCRECTQQEKDRDGCPKIVNLGSSKTDLFYERKKYGFKKR